MRKNETLPCFDSFTLISESLQRILATCKRNSFFQNSLFVYVPNAWFGFLPKCLKSVIEGKKQYFGTDLMINFRMSCLLCLTIEFILIRKSKTYVSEFLFGSVWIYINFNGDTESALSFYFIFLEKH